MIHEKYCDGCKNYGWSNSRCSDLWNRQSSWTKRMACGERLTCWEKEDKIIEKYCAVTGEVKL